MQIKKIMAGIASLALAATLCAALPAETASFSEIVTAAAAEDTDIVFSISDANVEVGTTEVVLTVDTVKNPGFAAGIAAITASNGAVVSNIETSFPGEWMTNLDKGKFIWNDALVEDNNTVGEFLKVTVTLPADAKDGDTFEVAMSGFDFASSNYIEYTASADLGVITVGTPGVTTTEAPAETTTEAPATSEAPTVTTTEGDIAADADIVLDIADANAEAGSSVDIVVSTTKNPGFAAAIAKVTATNGATVSNIVNNFDGEWMINSANGKFIWNDALVEDNNTVGAFITVTVDIPADAKDGDTFEVVMSDFDFASSDYQEFTVAADTGIITVGEAPDDTTTAPDVTTAPADTTPADTTTSSAPIADADIVLDVADANASAGEIVDIVISTTKNPGFAAAIAKVTATNGAVITDIVNNFDGEWMVNPENGKFIWNDALVENNDTVGAFITAKVQIPADAKDGDTFEIVVSDFDFASSDYQEFTVTADTGVITVGEAVTTTTTAAPDVTTTPADTTTTPADTTPAPVGDADVVLDIADAEVAVGTSTVDIVVSTTKNPGFCAGIAKVVVSGGATIAEMTNNFDGEWMWNDANGKFIWNDALVENNDTVGAFITVTVALPADAAAGDTFEVSMSDFDFADSSYNELSATADIGVITVVGDVTTTTTEVTTTTEPPVTTTTPQPTTTTEGTTTDETTTTSVTNTEVTTTTTPAPIVTTTEATTTTPAPADTDIVFFIPNAEAQPGATVDIVVEATKNPGFCAGIAKVVVSGGATIADMTNNFDGEWMWNDANGKFIWNDALVEDNATVGPFITITVQIPADAQPGDTFEVSMTDFDCANSVYDELSASANVGIITVPGAAVTTTPAPVVTTTPAPVVTTTPAPVVTTTPAPVVTTTTPAPVVTTTPAPVATTTDDGEGTGNVTGTTAASGVTTASDVTTVQTSVTYVTVTDEEGNPVTDEEGNVITGTSYVTVTNASDATGSGSATTTTKKPSTADSPGTGDARPVGFAAAMAAIAGIASFITKKKRK